AMERLGRGGGASSLRIRPTPCPSASVAPLGLDRLRKKSSSGSCWVSPLTVTLAGRLVVPAAEVSDPVGRREATPSGAVRGAGGYCTVTAVELAALKVTTKPAVTVPLLPSVTVTSATERVGSGGASSLRIRPTPWLSASVAPLGLDRLRKKSSSGSCC